MPDLSAALQLIAAGRRRDALAPVTVIVPSHVAGLQARRRLAGLGAYAAVRFETLPRLAELIGAGSLAAAGRAPLARPIGDYVAQQVAQESRGIFAGVAGLLGYARVLRQIFRRLRRGGLRTPDEARSPASESLQEILRLYGRFRQETARFYDEEDLFEAAAAVLCAGSPASGSALVASLGETFLVPPAGQSAGAAALGTALRARVRSYTDLDEAVTIPEMRFILAPDPASEAREAVREVVRVLEAGVALHEVAVFHGAGASYRALLGQAFDAAGIPVTLLPGTPLSETPAGRGILALARLPERDFSRAATMDFLRLSPLRRQVPGLESPVAVLTTAWDRISRAAGVTHGIERWSVALSTLAANQRSALEGDVGGESEARRRWRAFEAEQAEKLDGVVRRLAESLASLEQPLPAQAFAAGFKAILSDYFDPRAPDLAGVLQEVEQLGTVGAVGGAFSLGSFASALGANLEAATVRRRGLGEGVLVADYRVAAGLRFEHVVLCGAYEGALPASPGADALVDDQAWGALRVQHLFIEDAALRLERAQEAAQRAIASATTSLTWSSPLYEPGGAREYYPSPLMVQAARQQDSSLRTASDLRRHAADLRWLRRGSSPLAMALSGPLVDRWELQLRQAIALRRSGQPVLPDHPLHPAIALLRGRRSQRFTPWDGNLAALADDAWLRIQAAVSPTSLERYASCGFRYLLGQLLRLNVVEEPEERETMDPAARGSLVHRVLHAFFREQQGRGRPAPGEAWGEADQELLLALADREMEADRKRGLTGLDLFAAHQARTIRADLVEFLRQDSAFRRETGAIPSDFEVRIPEVAVGGVRLRGFVDRVDRSPDGRQAWIIDYKTGSKAGFEAMGEDDPFAGGTKLQLPTYVTAAGSAEAVHAAYWFISRQGGFEWVPYEHTPEHAALFRGVLGAAVEGIRRGTFPAVPGPEDERFGGWDNCRYCDFNRLCSRRRDDEFAEKARDGALEPWLRVGNMARGESGSRLIDPSP